MKTTEQFMIGGIEKRKMFWDYCNVNWQELFATIPSISWW